MRKTVGVLIVSLTMLFVAWAGVSASGLEEQDRDGAELVSQDLAMTVRQNPDMACNLSSPSDETWDRIAADVC